MGRIEWMPISEIPDNLKNGQEVLLWDSGGPVVGKWRMESPSWAYWDSGFASEIDGSPVEIIDPSHFAEINTPA